MRVDVLRSVFGGLGEETLAYLSEAAKDADDPQAFLDTFCDNLDVPECDRRRLFEALVGGPAAPPAAAPEALIAGGTLRQLFGEAEAEAPAPEAAVAATGRELEPAWAEGRVEAVRGQAALPVWAQQLFRSAWRQELKAWARRLSSRQVALLARSWGPHAEKVASVIEAGGFDGALCIAGGARMLTERLEGLKKAQVEASKHICRRLLDFLADNDTDTRTYRDLLWRPEEVAMLRVFAGTPVEPWLREVLRPAQPRYVTYEAGPEAHVKEIDAKLQQLWGGGSDGDERLRVAAILKEGVVQQNMVYVRCRPGGWRLVVSVDFCQHGEAPPGHWHLNRTPAGDQIEHWGPRGGVFHGTCWNCPLWWQVIPAGLEYLHRPLRVALLPDDVFGPAVTRSTPVARGKLR